MVFSIFLRTPLTLLVFFAAGLLATSEGTASVARGFDGIGKRTQVLGPSQGSDAALNPNATGAIKFSPTNTNQYALELKLNITADIPITDGEDTGSFTTASVLSLGGDAGALPPNTTVCWTVWFDGLSENITAAAQGKPSQDGAGCSGMLSDGCLSDLLIAGSQITANATNCFNLPTSLPASCSAQIQQSSSLGSGFKFNASSSDFFASSAGDYPERGNQTIWAEVATAVWPVFMAFVPDDTSSSSGGVEVVVNCIRPDSFSDGTADPNVAATGGGAAAPTGTATAPAASLPTSGAVLKGQGSVGASLGALAVGFVLLV